MGLPKNSPAVTADEIISAGFYSRYFHVSHDRRQEAKAYEKSLGPDIFRVALVSSVWQRSALTLYVSDEIQDWLLENDLLSNDLISAAAQRPMQPERIDLNLKGGVGAIHVKPVTSSDA